MKKNQLYHYLYDLLHKFGDKKLFLVMRICILFIMLSTFTLSATVKAQNEKVNINRKDISVETLFNEIQKQTGLSFIYSPMLTKDVSNIDVKAKDENVSKLLLRIFQNTDIIFEINGKLITLRKIKKNKEKDYILIKGRVLDKNKNPIPGATIRLKESIIGTSTNANGEYILKVEKQKSMVFIFSFIGMKTKEITYSGNNEINVILSQDVKEIEEVVVTGYSTIDSKTFTGNAIVIKKDDLLKVSKTNILKAIQAFDPSFRIKENNKWGSDPNALPEMYIRGESGIGTKELDRDALSKSNIKDNPNLPTFIMDGFEISATKLYDYDPNRISSITILKDAAATALYGSRAANGVVVITTVKPRAGKLNVSYNFVGGITYPDLTDYNLLNAKDKLKVEKLAGFYDAEKFNDSYVTQYPLDEEYSKKKAAVTSGIDTYWLSQPLHTVFNHNHSLYIDGGTQHLRFGFDLQYAKQDGVMKESFRNRINAGLYIQYLYKNITIRDYVTYNLTNSQDSPYGNFSDFSNQLPYDTWKNEDGVLYDLIPNWNAFGGHYNPMYEAKLHNFSKNKNEELINNLSFNWRIRPSLLFKTQLSITKNINKGDEFYDPLSKNSQNINIINPKNISSGTYYKRENDGTKFDLQSTLSFNKSIKEHNINAILGFNMQTGKTNYDNITYIGFPSGKLHSPQYAKEVYKKGHYSEDKKILIGYFGTLNYSYKNTYLLDLSVRLDGSSAFGADKRFATFYSFGMGLNIHKYDVIKNLEFINLLKVRGSYGETGKANFPAYAARTSYEMLSEEWYKTGFGVYLKALGNKDLTWETTRTLDIGAEIELFNKRFYLKGSYYDKETVDLINDVTVPTSTGFTSYRDNIGEISNKGYEFNLRYVAIKKDNLILRIDANLAHNTNRIEKISEALKSYNKQVQDMMDESLAYNDPRKELQKIPFTQYVEGGSINSIFGVLSNGINPADGQEVFIGKNGELRRRWLPSDQVILGTTEPDAQGSFGFNLTYKNFNLYSSFIYEFGAQKYNQTLVNKVENVNIYSHNVDKRVLKDRWQKPGDKAKYKSIKIDREMPSVTKPTSRFVQDYNMLQLSSLELEYSLAREITHKLSLSTLRFSIGLNDIFHVSSMKMERGTSYPFARTINFSLKATL